MYGNIKKPYCVWATCRLASATYTQLYSGF